MLLRTTKIFLYTIKLSYKMHFALMLINYQSKRNKEQLIIKFSFIIEYCTYNFSHLVLKRC